MKSIHDIQPFASLLHKEQHEILVAKGYNPDHHRHDVKVEMGKKFARVDVGDSGKYMVDLETGIIYGIKGYGVVHRGHQFGTLETINDWSWGEYRAVKKQMVEA